MSSSDSAESSGTEIRWTDGALKRMERAPVFLRGMVRRLAEKKARELGYEEIDEIKLLGFSGKIAWRRTTGGLVIDLPSQIASGPACVFKITKEKI